MSAAPGADRRRPRVRGLIAVLIALLAASFITVGVARLAGPSGHVVMLPGPTMDLRAAISEGSPGGQLRYTTVEFVELSQFSYLWSQLPFTTDFPEAQVAAGGEPTAPASRQMHDSKATAWAVARARTGPPPLGAQIAAVVPQSPAASAGLRVGDTIVAANAQPIATIEDLVGAVRALGPNADVIFTSTRGPSVVVELAAKIGADGRLGIEGTTAYGPETAPELDTADVGGSSAGLMLTLAFIDALGPGDLTAGATIAGTGTIAVDGTVGDILGIAEKAAGAHRDGATIFLGPASRTVELEQITRMSGMETVPVQTVDEAIAYLCSRGATDAVCGAEPA